MDEVKQVIVVRKDLNMRKGKIAAQACHASLAVFFENMHHPMYVDEDEYPYYQYIIDLTPEMHEWKQGIFKKICVYVNSEEELLDVIQAAEDAGLPCSLITDQGHTEFHGVPTITCGAVGPARSSALDSITGHLPLY